MNQAIILTHLFSLVFFAIFKHKNKAKPPFVNNYLIYSYYFFSSYWDNSFIPEGYGNISWVVATKNPLILSCYDDQKGSWDSISNKDSCVQKNNKAKTNRNVHNQVLSFEKFYDTKESHMWYFSLSDCNSDSITIESMQVHIWNPMSSKLMQEFSCDQQGFTTEEAQELKSGSDWAALADEVESYSSLSSNSEEDEKL
ncbi:intimal thickness receptor-related [Anaeramoeba flamelloides]|uniref:Intimal thickness receptor-related n=1 Tax=Anaeramoeba flamelloides TaxID=1746091 RepID=A0ABQ8Z6U2_9EUKA|nr:intimal thickness receptor-related [Anaeramoeba flamelloides]